MTTYVRFKKDGDSMLGCIINNSGTEHTIRMLTDLNADPVIVKLSPDDYQCILRVDSGSGIHQRGLLTLVDVAAFQIVFKEPILFPFAPRIALKTDANCCSDVLKWWDGLQRLHRVKRDIFMDLSYHQSGPIVDSVNAFFAQNTLEICVALSARGMESSDLRKALLIDGANTFDQ